MDCESSRRSPRVDEASVFELQWNSEGRLWLREELSGLQVVCTEGIYMLARVKCLEL